MGQLSKVAAIKRLREPDKEPFQTPPTNVNSLSKNLYFAILDEFETMQNAEEPQKAKAV